jgi:hypothetical protein
MFGANMKCKKILIITLVSLLLVSSLSPISYARFSILSNDSRENVKDTGVIEKQKLSSIDKIDNVFIINGDKGTVFLGRTYKRYIPTNLPDEFKKEGLRVEFTGEISLRNILSARGLSSLINLRALPIKIIDIKEIENKPDLKLDISIQDSFSPKDAISLKVELSNVGECSVIVSDIMIAAASLRLDIHAPNGDKISYFGPMINGWPSSVELVAGDKIVEEVDLTSGYWARNTDEYQKGGFAWFENPGAYSLQAFYYSSYPPDDNSEPSPDIPSDSEPYVDEQGRWHGSLSSKLMDFTVNEDKTAQILGNVRVNYSIPITQFTPISDAKVVAIKQIYLPSASDENQEIAYTTYTDSQGSYKLIIAPGEYEVEVSKEGFETKSRIIHIKDNDVAVANFALKEIVNLELKISIADQLEETKPIPVEVTLLNRGKYPAVVSEMALNLETLDFCIITPKGEKLCYIGPVIKRLPELVVVRPGLENAYKVTIEDIKNLFGIDDSVDSPDDQKTPYSFEPGSYSIQSIYESGKATGDDWEGELSSIAKEFRISGWSKQFSITSPKDQETIRGTVDICVSILNYPPEVEVRIDEGEWVTIECAMACCESMGCDGFGSYSWDTTQVKNGEHTIEARVYDESKEEHIYDSIHVIVNNELKPQFSIETPSNGDIVTGAIKVTGYTYSVPPLPLVKEIYFSIDRGEWQQAKLYGLGISNPNNQIGYWEYEWDTSIYSNGEHRIGVMAWNGIENSYDSIRVIVKNVESK